ncbi:MAG: polysaccharide biosynthesis protein [Oscillospiraceae bacterium]|nr:polysaccharide biosynthesis protein [Oscillospiraceae bacterium]
MKQRRSILRKALLVLQDIIFINLSSFLAIWVRFNMEIAYIPPEFASAAISMIAINTIGTIAIFALFRMYTTLWRYAHMREVFVIVQACGASFLLNILSYVMLSQHMFRSYFPLYAVCLFMMVSVGRFSYRFTRMLFSKNGQQQVNTMIVGAGEAGSMVMSEIERNRDLRTKVRCIIDDNPQKHGAYIHGVRVVGGREQILGSIEKYNITEIIVALPSISEKERQKIVGICKQATGCEVKVVPGVYQLMRDEVSVNKIRKVKVEELLGRDVVELTTEKVGRYVSGKTVLVTGGAGSIGSELCRQIAANGVGQLIIFDIYENNAYELQQELRNTHSNLDLVVLIGSVRCEKRLENVFATYRPDIVYHAAAHKHVPLMEDSPNEAIKNNVFGTYNTALAAANHGVERFILISTDKAVNPTNIMGASKRICEMVMQLCNNRYQTEFVAVRFGNVLGSNGSVIPVFTKQIEAGGPVTVTHPEVTRYFMTIPEATSLVLQAGADAKGGEIFVLDMGQAVKIKELAERLIRLSGFTPDVDIEIKYSGLRPGEKLYEELLMDEEKLLRTENKLIFIEKPTEFNENEFLDALKQLYRTAYSESDSIKQLVHSIVPAYQLKERDIKKGTPRPKSVRQAGLEGSDFRSGAPIGRLQKLEYITETVEAI